MHDLIPSAEEINQIVSATSMRRILARRDLPDSRKWWTAVVSVCTSGLATAESGAPDAEAWGQLLLDALNRSVERGALAPEDVVHRRLMACAAGLKYFGVREGDVLRDPDSIVRRAIADLGGSAEQLVIQYREFAATGAHEDLEPQVAYGRAKWLSSVRLTLETLPDVVRFMDHGPLRDEALRWCGAARLLFGAPPVQ